MLFFESAKRKKMSSQIKPIKVWGSGHSNPTRSVIICNYVILIFSDGANPPKGAILLEELGLPHEIVPVPFSDVKKPDYITINPNGRVPAIRDPNTGITLWESGVYS